MVDGTYEKELEVSTGRDATNVTFQIYLPRERKSRPKSPENEFHLKHEFSERLKVYTFWQMNVNKVLNVMCFLPYVRARESCHQLVFISPGPPPSINPLCQQRQRTLQSLTTPVNRPI